MMEYVLFQKVECSVEVSAIQLHHSHKTDWCGPLKARAAQRPVCILFHFCLLHTAIQKLENVLFSVSAWESMKVNKRRGRRWWSIRIANICHFICGRRYFKKSHILRELHTNHKISNISQLWNMPVKMVTIQSWFEYLFLWQVKYRQRIPQLVKQVVINEMQKLTQNRWCEWKTLHTWPEGLKSLTGQT